MKAGSLERPATFIFILSCFTTFLARIDGFELLDLEVDETDFRQKHGDFLTDEILVVVDDEEKSKTCADLSFNHPLQCIKNGCRLNPVTGECRYNPDHVKRRVKRDAKSKCFHFNKSPRICGYNGCKYDVKRKLCLKADGSEDPEVTETPKPTKLEKQSIKEGKPYYKFQEKPTTKYCARFHGKPHACGLAGCSFDKWSHRCIVGRSKGRSPQGEDDGNGGIGSEERDSDGLDKSSKGSSHGKDDGVVSVERDSDGDEKGSKGRSLGEGGLASGEQDEQDGEPGSRGRSLTETSTCSKFSSEDEKCVRARIGCLFHESTRECIEATEPPSTGEKSKKHCDVLHGKKKNCHKAGCSYNKANKKCSSEKEIEEVDTVAVDYLVMIRKNKENGSVECSELNNCPRGCFFAGCQYNEDDSTCKKWNLTIIALSNDLRDDDITSLYLTTEECSVLNGKQRACTAVGCIYDETNQNCTTGRRIPNNDRCEPFDEQPVKCLTEGCLFDTTHFTCFEGVFPEYTYTVTYVQVKSTHNHLKKEQCALLDGSSAGCSRACCKFDNETSKCLETDAVHDESDHNKNTTLSHEECSAFNNKLRACGYAGCRYNTKDKKCIGYSEKNDCGILDGDEDSCNEAGCSFCPTSHNCNNKAMNGSNSERSDSDSDDSYKPMGRTLGADGEYDKGEAEGVNERGDEKSGGNDSDKGSNSEGSDRDDSYKPKGRTLGADGEYDKGEAEGINEGGDEKSGGNDSDKSSKSEGTDSDDSYKPMGRTLGADGRHQSDEKSGGDDSGKGSKSRCKKYNGMRKKCRKANCKYKKSTKSCSAPEGKGSGNEGSWEQVETHSDSEGRSAKGGRSPSRAACAKNSRPENKEKCINAGCHYDDRTDACNRADSHSRSIREDVERLKRWRCQRMDGEKECIKAKFCRYERNTKKCVANRATTGKSMRMRRRRQRARGNNIESESSEEDKLKRQRERQNDDDYWNDQVGDGTSYSAYDSGNEHGGGGGGDYVGESLHSEEGGCNEHHGKQLSCRRQPGCTYNKTTKECCGANISKSDGYAGLFYLFPVNGANGEENWAERMKKKVNDVIDAMKS